MKRIIQLGISGLASSLTLFALHSAQAQSSADLVAAALSHPDRPSEEAQDDARRMPLELLSFAGLSAGMDVLEMEAGGGWYTCLLYTSPSPRDGLLSRMPSSA